MKNILIIQTAFIGDIILTLPLIEAVHSKYPGSIISFVIIPNAYGLVEANPYLDKIVIYDKKGKDKGLGSFLRLVKEISKDKYDLAILPHRSLRSALLAFLSGIPERIGFDRSQGRIFLTKTVKYNRDKHEVERNLELIDEKAQEKRIPLFLSNDDMKKADEFLRENKVKEKDILIGIAPGSAWLTKRWIKERFAELARNLIDNYRAKIIIFGGKDDEKLADEIKKISSRDLITAAGTLSLGESASVISRCKLFISNDTAPLHFASAFNIPVLAIFGPTTVSLGFGPYTSKYFIVEKDLKCRPCGKHGHNKCPKGHFKCMEDIQAEEVFEACKRFLEKSNEYSS